MPDKTVQDLLSVALALLDQSSALLEQLQDQHLVYSSPLLPGSTIGKHLRHLTDHYSLLTRATRSADGAWQLDYDARLRNGPAESQVPAARESVSDVSQRLRLAAEAWEAEEPVRLKAKTPFEVQVGSTVARELWFCSLHAIHHLAMVRVLAAELKIALPEDFGVAPSTLLYQQAQVSTG